MKEHTIEDTIAEVQASNAVYYRLFVNYQDQPCVVEMQWFDEFDYDQDRFINNEHYDTEQKAEDALLTLKVKAGLPLSTLEKLKLIAKS
ncbi:MAG TPA: hypothetical protein VGN34_26000 [Ktedonobacteraceae bacterium]|jgi:hypothetical protein